MIGFFVWFIILCVIGAVGGLIADKITSKLEGYYASRKVHQGRRGNNQTF